MVNFSLRAFRTERLVISDLTVEDAMDMAGWKKHSSVLFSEYNFDNMTVKERLKWYHFKTDSRKNHYYSAREKGKLVGYFGIKDTSKLFRESTLGIVLDAGRMGEGFGRDILENFLAVYFGEFKMRKLSLKVAEYNERAIRLYEAMGFRKTRVFLESLTDEEASNPSLLKNPKFFKKTAQGISFYVRQMEKRK